MKPASCFGDLASFSNRQKRLHQNRRYAVDIHNDDFRTRLLVVLLTKPTNDCPAPVGSGCRRLVVSCINSRGPRTQSEFERPKIPRAKYASAAANISQ